MLASSATIHTSTMQSSALEPASHGTDSMIVMLPSVYSDLMVRRKDWTGTTDGNPQSTMNVDKVTYVERTDQFRGPTDGLVAYGRGSK